MPAAHRPDAALVFSDHQRELLLAANIDYRRTEELLRDLRQQRTARADNGAVLDNGTERDSEAKRAKDGDASAERENNIAGHALESPELEIPEIDNDQIFDARGDIELRLHHRHSLARLARYIPYDRLQAEIAPRIARATTKGITRWNRDLLAQVGVALYPLCGYGLLNGGSATSYLDPIHNQRFNAELFAQWRERFERARRQYGALPKALCPALHDGENGDNAESAAAGRATARSEGVDNDRSADDRNADHDRNATNDQSAADDHSAANDRSAADDHSAADDLSAPLTFLELRVRHLVRASMACGTKIPLFQMTSSGNSAEIMRATEAAFAAHYGGSTEEARAHYMREGQPLCAPQTHFATFARHGEEALPLDAMPPLFRSASNDAADTPYGLPGGHGQCFSVLRRALQRLLDGGTRFVFIGNIDNLGYTLNPVTLAYLVLRDGTALFEYAPRSAVDRKGGILARDRQGRVSGAELGSDISLEAALRHEAAGKTVLFNCAIGLFDLERLLVRMDEYIHRLPVHCIGKKTARGEYWQLEQITWDIIKLIDNPYIFVGTKTERFLSAKLVAETFMLSGIPVANPHSLADNAAALFGAMERLALREYGVGYDNRARRWFRKAPSPTPPRATSPTPPRAPSEAAARAS